MTGPTSGRPVAKARLTSFAVTSCRKRTSVAGLGRHRQRIRLGERSFPVEPNTKWVIVVDDDIDARDWKDVIRAISTRMGQARDITLIENTPIDYLDFASPEESLGPPGLAVSLSQSLDVLSIIVAMPFNR